jgi:hypothetical protein
MTRRAASWVPAFAGTTLPDAMPAQVGTTTLSVMPAQAGIHARLSP